MKRIDYGIGAAALILLIGCSTPQAALDQANNGAALMGTLDAELREFRRVQNVIAQYRMDVIRNMQASMAESNKHLAFHERVLETAGGGRSGLARSLQALANSSGEDERAFQETMKELDEYFAKLLQPLPDTSQKLGEAQKTIAIMGDELSTAERVKIISEFAKEVKKSVMENKQKINDAENAVRTGTTSSSP